MTDSTAEKVDSLRDMRFNPFLRPASEGAKKVIAEFVATVERYESQEGLRKRKRKARDQRIFELTISAVLSNAMLAHLIDPEMWVAVSLSKDQLGRRSRYGSPVLTKTLPDILRRLAAEKVWVVELEVGHLGYFSQPRLTTFRAGPFLASRVMEYDLSPKDIQASTDQEVIILKKAKQGHWDKGEMIDYQDDAQTNGFRDEVHKINQWLAQADIKFYGRSASGEKVDTTDRLLRRYFNNGSFQQGGRLFGGFWQPLGKLQRNRGLRINGEGVVTLDFGQMVPRILYSMAGVEPAQEDIYRLLGLESHRAGVKKVFNAILFADKPLERLPQGTRELLPRRVGMKDVVDLLAKTHEPLVPYFFTGVGYHLQYRESEILIDVLLTMMEQGIVGLPIHDAVIVPKSSAGEVEMIMLATFKAHTGLEGIVEVDE